NDTAPTTFGTGGVDDPEALIGNLAKGGTAGINPAKRMNIRGVIQFLIVRPGKFWLSVDWATDREVILRQCGKGIEHQVQPLMHQALAAEPQKMLAAGLKIFLVRPRTGHGGNHGYPIDRLLRVTIGTHGEGIADGHRTIRMLNAPVHVHRFVRGDSDTLTLL